VLKGHLERTLLDVKRVMQWIGEKGLSGFYCLKDLVDYKKR